MTPTEALAALTKLAQQSSGEPTRDEHDGPTCRRCERDFSVDDEDDDDGLCHACAHEICLELPAIAAALAASAIGSVVQLSSAPDGMPPHVRIMTQDEFDSPENASFKSWVQTNLENDERRRDSAIASAARLEGDRAGYARALDAVRDGLQNGVNPSDLIPMLRSKLTDTGGSDA